jgi:hypothetical protein
MSKRESFLARWSRRKQAAAAEAEPGALPIRSEQRIADKETTEGAAATAGLHKDGVALPARGTDATATFLDPASLPPIESIAADTDIRAFLAPGVPPELARTALRRAWAADPKIRDFVGLADYDWDFNAPGSMAGFGPLEMTEELREIADRIIGPPPVESAADPAESSDLSEQEGSRSENPELIHYTSEHKADAGDSHSKPDPPGRGSAKTRPDRTEKSQLVVRQRHGGALPK